MHSVFTIPTKYYLRDGDLYGAAVQVAGGEFGAGVYRLYSEPNGTPAVIRRFFIDDNMGLLYIGGANRLPRRATQIYATLMSAHRVDKYRQISHSGVAKVAKNQTFLDLHPFDGLFLALETSDYFETDRKLKWRAHEAAYMREYRDVYGELPPLNR